MPNPKPARKDHPETSPEGLKAKAAAEKADAETSNQVAKQMKVETEQGYRGLKVDPTPDENYTVSGVTAGKPTPETDDKQAEKARKAQSDTAVKAAGVAGR